LSGFSLERLEGVSEGEGGGAFGEATGHEEPSAGGGKDFCGGNEGVEEEGDSCIGHPGW